MHSKSSNYIGYTGTVRCTLKKNNRTLLNTVGHNNGEDDLFTFLAICLAGDYVGADSLCPQCVSLQDDADNVLTVLKPLTSHKPPVTIDNAVAVVLSFMIDATDWTNTNSKATKLVLHGKSALGDSTGQTAKLATYNLNSTTDTWGDFSQWSSSSVLLIDWQLEVHNYNDVSSIINGGA